MRNLGIYLLLAAALLACYAQVLHFDFVTYDDPDYVTANARVQNADIAWAFRTGYAGNWFPLTWLSHMLDYALFGLDAGAHHFTNVVLHLLTTLLCFAWLVRLTGARWRSALVAFLFALHPLHVESVAWVAERKDVLSGLFCVLTLMAYTRGRRWLALVLFCCGLMAKPMLVTLPIVLLLLDWWPLRRGLHLVEKLPFFAASIAVSVITFLAHREAGATASLALIPPLVRFENALVSYAAYIVQMFWPVGLAVFYPYPLDSLAVPAIFAALAIAAVTAFAIRYRDRFPYLTVGWLWYLVMLLPVIGIVQVGAQARADRYTYLPMLGLSVALVWGAADLLSRYRRVQAPVAAAVCLACAILTFRQVSYWHDSVTLYQHAIAATTGNYVAHYNLAVLYDGRGQLDDAAAQYRETVRARPLFAPAHLALGQILAKQSRPADAAPVFAAYLRLQPDNPDAHYNYALALAQSNNIPDAAREFRATLALRPADIESRFNLAIALSTMGQREEAVSQMKEVLKLRPDFAPAVQELASLTR
jgi:tetratricopeptide (TPR) repeat protein